MDTLRTHYPFSALHGQSELRLALLLVAIDPQIGGVLIEGPRGTAKSTSARALADLLPTGAFVNLPLGASEEQLAGSLDIQAALQTGDVVFRPGLLAKADGGVLYVDEVNLLPDVLVDLLLDVCASGVNRIERDGISHQHPARVALVGTMNPEEGELRPQLLDRFGLFVRLVDRVDRATREQIVRSRLRFDRDPKGFLAEYEAEQASLSSRLAIARQRASTFEFSDALHADVSERCYSAGVEGVRADLVMLRAAAAHAALQGRDAITLQDVDAIAPLVLAHRRQDVPDGQPHSTPEETPAGHPPQSRNVQADWGAMSPEVAPIQPLGQASPPTAKKY